MSYDDKVGALPAVDSDYTADVKPSFTRQDFIDHRQVFVGLHHRPSTEKKPKRSPKLPKFTLKQPPKSFRWENGKKTTKHSDDSASETEVLVDTLPAPASERVKFILGGEEEEVISENPHLFTELEELFVYLDGNVEWKETARWYKYEEDVEEGGDRWSKPHVATLSLLSLLGLRSSLMAGTVMLDMDARTLSDVADLVIDNLISCNKLEEIFRAKVRDTLLRKHRHQRNTGFRRNLSNIIGSRKNINMINNSSSTKINRENSVTFQPSQNGHTHPEITINTKDQSADGNRQSQADRVQLFRNYSQPAFPSTPPQTQLGVNKPGFERSSSVQGHLVYPPPTPLEEEHNTDKTPAFWKKLPANSEASNILVGEVDFLEKPITAFVRLSNSAVIGDLTEVPIPTRFLFIMLGPCVSPGRYHEIGRAISTLMADEVFHDVAYKAKSRDDLIAGIDEFLEQVIVLPPGEWDPSIRIDPPQNGVAKLSRRQVIENKSSGDVNIEQNGSNGAGSESGSSEEFSDGVESFSKSGKLFGGLTNDMKNWVKRSRDIRDGINLQCVGTVFFLYIALIAVLATVGEHQKHLTNGYMGMREQLIVLFITGIPFAMFSGQPLLILSLSMPMVLFDGYLHTITSKFDLDYLPFRLWIGLWTLFFLLLAVALDLSRLVRYLTHFTKDIFVVLSPLVLFGYGIVYTCKLLVDFSKEPGTFSNHTCQCIQYTYNNITRLSPTSSGQNVTSVSRRVGLIMDVDFRDCIMNNWTLVGGACQHDVIPVTLLMVISTVVLIIFFSSFQRFGFLPGKVHQFFHDFASLLTVLIVSSIGNKFRTNVPYLLVPKDFQPDPVLRGSWTVSAFGSNNPWLAVLAIVPAFFYTLLILVEQQVTASCINRKQNLLKKSSGYHLDLFVLLLGVCFASILGLPFAVASVILSFNHLQALKDNAHIDDFIGGFTSISEQRVTSVCLYVLVALTPMMRSMLKFIPVPVLYGVLIVAMARTFNNVQFVRRFTLLFIPKEKQPDVIYLRQVPLISVKIYTVVQVVCLAACWGLRATPGAFVFPFMIFFMVLLRYLLEKVLPLHDVLVLDDAMPKLSLRCCRTKYNKDDMLLEEGQTVDHVDYAHLDVLHDHNKANERVNLSEEISKTAAWKQLTYNENSNSPLSNSPKDKDDEKDGSKKRRKKRTRDSTRSKDGSSPPKHNRKISSSSKPPSELVRNVPKSPEDMITEPFDYAPSKDASSKDSDPSHQSIDDNSLKRQTSKDRNSLKKQDRNSIKRQTSHDKNSLKRHNSKDRGGEEKNSLKRHNSKDRSGDRSKRHDLKERGGSKKERGSDRGSLKHQSSHDRKVTKQKQIEENPPPPWELPYASPPRKDLGLLKIPENDLSFDPACLREDSQGSNENSKQCSPVNDRKISTENSEPRTPISPRTPMSPDMSFPTHDSCDASSEQE